MEKDADVAFFIDTNKKSANDEFIRDFPWHLWTLISYRPVVKLHWISDKDLAFPFPRKMLFLLELLPFWKSEHMVKIFQNKMLVILSLLEMS